MQQRKRPPAGGFLLPDHVKTGWRYGTRWLLVSTTRQGMRIHEFEVTHRSKGAFQC